MIATCRKRHEKDANYTITSYGQSSGNSTLLKHLQDRHPRSYDKCIDMQKGGTGTPSGNDQTNMNGHVHEVEGDSTHSKRNFALACLRLISACDLVSKQ